MGIAVIVWHDPLLELRLGINMYNILAVDEKMDNLNALKRALRQSYNVFTATKEEVAFSIMEQNEIALIIVDYRMPHDRS